MCVWLSRIALALAGLDLLNTRCEPPPASESMSLLSSIRHTAWRIKLKRVVALPTEGAPSHDAPLPSGATNENPRGIGLAALLAEDLRTHGGRVLEPGF